MANLNSMILSQELCRVARSLVLDDKTSIMLVRSEQIATTPTSFAMNLDFIGNSGNKFTSARENPTALARRLCHQSNYADELRPAATQDQECSDPIGFKLDLVQSLARQSWQYPGRLRCTQWQARNVRHDDATHATPSGSVAFPSPPADDRGRSRRH